MPIQIEVPGQGIVEFPDGMTDQQIESAIKANSKPSISEKIEKAVKTPFLNTVGIGEAALQMGTGMGASVVGGIRGLFNPATAKGIEQASEDVKSTQQALTYQPRTQQGRTISNILSAPTEYATKIAGVAGKEIQKGGEFGRFFGNTSQGLEGEAIGEAAVPIAGMLYGGRGAIKSVATTPFKKPVMPSMDVPIISDAVKGIRDVARSRTEIGRQKLATEYLQSLTTPDEAVKITKALETRGNPIVPNSPVTSAEAIARANRQLELLGRPERFGGQYVTLQEGLSKVPETTATLNTIKLLQEKARSDVLNKGAGTELAYKAQEAIRKANANSEKGYGAIKDFVVQSDKDINLLMTRPSMIKALEVAENLAKEKGDIFKFGKDIPEQTIASSMLDANGAPLSKITIPAQLAKYPIESLQYTKMALDKMIKKPKDYGIEAMDRSAMLETRNQLLNWIESKSDLYKKANALYAIDTLPLNQMDLWRALQEKFVTPSGKEAPGSYLKALRDENKLISQNTGSSATELKSIFNEKQSSLAARLASEFESELLKKRMAGEVSIPGIGRAAEGLEPKLPNMLMRETMVANFLIRQLAKNANVDVNIAAAKILKDPKMLASVLKQVKPEHRTQILKEIKNNAGSAAVVGISNMEQEQQQ
jgi:hypothetical protein